MRLGSSASDGAEITLFERKDGMAEPFRTHALQVQGDAVIVRDEAKELHAVDRQAARVVVAQFGRRKEDDATDDAGVDAAGLLRVNDVATAVVRPELLEELGVNRRPPVGVTGSAPVLVAVPTLRVAPALAMGVACAVEPSGPRRPPSCRCPSPRSRRPRSPRPTCACSTCPWTAWTRARCRAT